MNVSYARTASMASVGIVCYREETHSALNIAGFNNFPIEVVNDWDVHGGRAGLDPIFAELVPVPCVDRLDRVSEIIKDTVEQ